MMMTMMMMRIGVYGVAAAAADDLFVKIDGGVVVFMKQE